MKEKTYYKKRGRPATGRTTKVVRVPKEANAKICQKAVEIEEIINTWKEIIKGKEKLARWEKTNQLLNDLLLEINS